MWPRDGALVAMALDVAGHGDLTRRFFEFCGRSISRGGYLLHKFGPTGEVGSSWHPWVDASGEPQLAIQEDETGLVLMSLWHHYQRWRDIEFIRPLFRRLISNGGEFLMGFREPHTGLPAASYDLWEERHGIHAFTIAAVWAGLQAAANFAELFSARAQAQLFHDAAREIKAATTRHLYDPHRERFVRMVQVSAGGRVEKDPTVDASLSALPRFGMYPPNDPRIVSTMAAVEERLWCKTPVGGLARYEHDPYFLADADRGRVPGNPWFVCTLWLAQYHIARAQKLADLESALKFLQWVEGHALPSGVLAEQIHPGSGTPLSVSPLTWSHGELVLTVQQYLNRLRSLQRRAPRARRTQAVVQG
jgi:GH15 family glucan-1,4-alpha-glucosidase